MRGVWLMGFKVSSLTVCQPRLSSLTKLARRPMTHPCCLNFWHQRDQSGACHAPEKPTPARPFRAALGHPRRRAHLFWFWGASPPCFFTLKSRMRGGGGNSYGESWSDGVRPSKVIRAGRRRGCRTRTFVKHVCASVAALYVVSVCFLVDRYCVWMCR